MQEGNWDWLSEGAGCHWNGGNKKGQSRDRFPEKFGAGREVREEISSSQRRKRLRTLTNEGAKT